MVKHSSNPVAEFPNCRSPDAAIPDSAGWIRRQSGSSELAGLAGSDGAGAAE